MMSLFVVLTATVSGKAPVLATCASRIFCAASCPLAHAAGEGIRYCCRNRRYNERRIGSKESLDQGQGIQKRQEALDESLPELENQGDYMRVSGSQCHVMADTVVKIQLLLYRRTTEQTFHRPTPQSDSETVLKAS